MCSKDECEYLVQEILKNNAKLQNILINNVEIKEQNWKIRCKTCSDIGIEGTARAFITENPKEIILCNNRLPNRSDVTEVLIHESIHVYDYVNKICDFNTCDGIAYTEIRASRDAECSKYFPFQWMKYNCIKQTATSSTSNLFGKQANQCVMNVFEQAIQDHSPIVIIKSDNNKSIDKEI